MVYFEGYGGTVALPPQKKRVSESFKLCPSSLLGINCLFKICIIYWNIIIFMIFIDL